MSSPATPPRMCGCNPRYTEVFGCEECGWEKPCRYIADRHEEACSSYRKKFVLKAVPDVTPAGHCGCSGHWLDSVREECYDRQVGRNMCGCPGGGIPHTRNQLNRCQRCNNWLVEVWRGLEPTRTCLRFMISRLRDANDSTLGGRYNIHRQHAAVMSKYDWLPPLQQGGEQRAYYPRSLADMSHEAAYWLRYVTRELWMIKPLLRQLMLGRFGASNDSAQASRHVCESDV